MSEIPYNQQDHYHCWEYPIPPCGQKIEHLKCCLCEKLNPKAMLVDLISDKEKITQGAIKGAEDQNSTTPSQDEEFHQHLEQVASNGDFDSHLDIIAKAAASGPSLRSPKPLTNTPMTTLLACMLLPTIYYNPNVENTPYMVVYESRDHTVTFWTDKSGADKVFLEALTP